jgi:hypothetical protein
MADEIRKADDQPKPGTPKEPQIQQPAGTGGHGIASGHNPGGTLPGGGPGAGLGSLGTGGGSTGGAATGSVKRGGA